MSSEIALTATLEGVSFRVRVTPRGGRTALGEVKEGALGVRLKAPPVDGAANRELCAFLSKLLNRPRRDIEIIRGSRGRDKTVLVTGGNAREVAAAFQSVLE
ncbi:MAG: DUF167 domain-containing protein [Thermomicrobiaceae bacterium]